MGMNWRVAGTSNRNTDCYNRRDDETWFLWSHDMIKKQLRQLLSDLSFSAQLPDPVLKAIADAALLVDYPTGSVLFREGSLNDNLYLIVSGRVNLEMCVPARGCVRLLTLGRGDIVAWSAVLGQGLMTSTALAAEDTQLIALSGARLLEICDARPKVGYQLMRRLAHALSRRLLATRLQMLDLFSHESPAINA